MNGIPAIMATVTIAGFAIQQILELLDPLVTLGVKRFLPVKQPDETPIPAKDAKKWAMALLGVILGAIVASITDISLLSFIDPDWKGRPGDLLVTALVLGAGTEGLNTLTKFFGYVKEARKPTPVAVAVVPTTVRVAANGTFSFRATVSNSENQTVAWEVSHGAGGTIDNSGKYTAPAAAGTYQIVAVSAADPTKVGTATVTVT